MIWVGLSCVWEGWICQEMLLQKLYFFLQACFNSLIQPLLYFLKLAALFTSRTSKHTSKSLKSHPQKYMCKHFNSCLKLSLPVYLRLYAATEEQVLSPDCKAWQFPGWRGNGWVGAMRWPHYSHCSWKAAVPMFSASVVLHALSQDDFGVISLLSSFSKWSNIWVSGINSFLAVGICRSWKSLWHREGSLWFGCWTEVARVCKGKDNFNGYGGLISLIN